MSKRHSPRLFAVLLLLPLGSCALEGGKHACAHDSDCLTGRVCRAGTCRSADAGGSGGSGDESGSGGSGAESGADSAGAGGKGGERGEGGSADERGSAGESDAAGSGMNEALGGSADSAPGGHGGTMAGTAAGEDPRGSGGDSGMGGDPGGASGASNGGIEPPPRCDPYDPEVAVECVFSPNSAPLDLVNARGAAIVPYMIAPEAGSGFYIFASQIQSNAMAITWSEGQESWHAWSCFDVLPSPERVAGQMLRDGSPEVFVTGRCGTLYERRQPWDLANFSAWAPVSLPSAASVVTDVTTSNGPDGNTILYVADRGTVYVRRRVGLVGVDPPFGPWSEVGRSGGTLITAAMSEDQRQLVFALDEHGHPLWTSQMKDVNVPFDSFRDFDEAAVVDSFHLPPFVDIESPYRLNPPEVWAVDDSGLFWVRRVDGGLGGFTPWTLWKPPSTTGKIVSISAAALGDTSFLVATTDQGVIELFERHAAGEWERVSMSNH